MRKHNESPQELAENCRKIHGSGGHAVGNAPLSEEGGLFFGLCGPVAMNILARRVFEGLGFSQNRLWGRAGKQTGVDGPMSLGCLNGTRK